MNYAVETALVCVNTLILGYFVTRYLKSKNSAKQVYDVREIGVSHEMLDALKEAGGSLAYVSIRGKVEALSPPLHCFNAPSVTGVVQKVTVREHVVSQSKSGFWVDHKRPINTLINSVPFAVKSSTEDVKVEVLDALTADVLDLEVVADRFDPAPSSLLQTIGQFITGYRKQGVHTMEEVLKEGTLVTVVGEVVGNEKTVTVGPPSNGAPFFITTMPLRSLFRKIESEISYFKWMSVGVGVVTAATCCWFLFKIFNEYYRKEKERRRLQESRKERRKRVRTENLSEDKLCVVCQSNPLEVILLPCGHVCLCEDCSEKISSTCPICNRKIESRNEAYIS